MNKLSEILIKTGMAICEHFEPEDALEAIHNAYDALTANYSQMQPLTLQTGIVISRDEAEMIINILDQPTTLNSTEEDELLERLQEVLQ